MIGAFASVAGYLGLLSFSAFQPWWLLTIVVACVFTWLQFVVPQSWARLVPLAEAAVAVILVTIAGPVGWPLLIYVVMAPAFVGIAVGGWLPVLVAAAQLGALVLVSVVGDPLALGIPDPALLRLGLLGLLFGAAASLARTVVDRNLHRPGEYAQALALLEQLSAITRQLPSGLGMDAVAAETQTRLAEDLGAAEVAIFTPRGNMWALQVGPSEAAPLAGDLGLAMSQPPRFMPVGAAASDSEHAWIDSAHLRALPLWAAGELRAFAVARYETRPPTLTADRLRTVSEDAAARLAAAGVYAEVRERATAEERRRVSREIHDGVAQDLAALTYQLDNLAEETGLPPIADAAGEVRRLVRELRLSIFDLRTDLGSSEALGAAIGEYSQQVSTSTGIVVHTTVSEHGAPLDPHVQHELLRVCQEAVANARRHSRARNMWITYKNHGEGWMLRVADDGVGVAGSSVANAFGGEGLAIMRERVGRVGGRLSVRRRIGGGTVVEVTLERGPHRLSEAGQ